jgi:ATP-dependent Clp protease protease subunit
MAMTNKNTNIKVSNKLDENEEEEIISQLMGGQVGGFTDIDNREIYILDMITPQAYEKYIIPIMEINKEDDAKDIPIEERRPIKIYIACNGGDVVSGMSLINIIKVSKTPTIAIVFHAYSMGALISIACDARFCYEFSTFMFHDGMSGAQTTTTKMLDYLKHLSKQENKVKDFIVENTNISKQMVNKKYSNDWFLNAEEALKLGVVDGILSEII